MFTYYHGTKDIDGVLSALVGNGMLRNNFHLTPSIEVARNYGAVVVIELESDLTKAHFGMINKDGNSNSAVGNGIEVVLKDQSAINELYYNLEDAYVL